MKINGKFLIFVFLMLTLTNAMNYSQNSQTMNTRPETTEIYSIPNNSIIPEGFIGIWTGSIANIPEGWILCDGTDSTLNLTDRFPYGVDNEENPGEITDSVLTTHNHSYTQVPKHDHSVTDLGHDHPIRGRQIEYNSGAGATIYTISGNSASTSNITTGISLENAGNSTSATENTSSLPPYYKVAFIQKTNQAPDIIPQGIILLWNGTQNSIPNGWAFCNGTAGTPDLTNRFLMGVDANEEPGSTGGTQKHNHTYYSIPLHTHTIIDSTHNHTFDSIAGTEVEAGSDFYGTTPVTNNMTVNSTLGISIDTTGIAAPQTSNTTTLPPYLRLGYIQALSNQTYLPKNILALWGLSWSSIPTGWTPANGTAGTPELTLRFAMSIDNDEEPGTMGGNSTHSHVYSEIPTHNHNVIDPGHNHSIVNETLVEGYRIGTGVQGEWPDDSADPDFNTQVSPSYITVEDFGEETCNTDTRSNLPPYCKVIYIQHTNTPPEVSNLQITENPTTTADLIGSYQYTDAENDVESGTLIRWFRNGTLQAEFNNLLTVPHAFTNKSENWSFTVLPKDGIDEGRLFISNNVTIKNTAPNASNLQITPATPYTNDSLTASYTFGDADKDTESGTLIRWYRNGTLQKAFNNLLTVPHVFTNKTENWSFTIQPCDGEEFGLIYNSTNITILNTAPNASNVAINPDSPSTTNILTASYTYFDADNDIENNPKIRWYMREQYGIFSIQTHLNDNVTVPAAWTNRSQIWYFTIQTSDGDVLGSLQTSSQITIQDSLPVASNVVISPNLANRTCTLTLTYNYTDADGDAENTILRQISWYKNGTLQTGLNNAQSVGSQYLTKGDIWYCNVTPINLYGTGLTVKSENITIQNAIPSAQYLNITPQTPSTYNNLVANYTFLDPDVGDTENTGLREIRWYRNGTLQAGFNDLITIPYAWTNISDNWHFEIRVHDFTNYSNWAVSANYTIINAAPSASNLQLSPTSPKTTNNLVASYTYNDPENDPENGTEIKWFRIIAGNPYEQTNFENLTTIPAVWTNKSQIWYFTVRPKDGTSFGTLQTSNEVTIADSPPEASNVTIHPTPAFANSNLTVTYNYTDADGDAENTILRQIRWYNNTILQENLNNQLSVPSNYLIKGDYWMCTITPYSTNGVAGQAATSTPIQIENAIPSAQNLTIYPLNPTTIDDLIANYTFYDPDVGDTENILVRQIYWYRNGTLQVRFTNSMTVPHVWTNKSDNWHFEIIVGNGITSLSERAISNNQSIENTAPNATNLQISPSSPNPNENLHALYTFSDNDNDIEGISLIQWYKNGLHQAIFDNSTIILAIWTNQSELWHFTVRPFDGMDYGEIKISSNVSIGNSPPSISNVYISPVSPTSRDNLTVFYTYSDFENDTESGTQIRWYRHSILIPELNNLKEVPYYWTNRTDIWTCTVTGSDGMGNSSTVQSITFVYIANAPPSLSNLKITPSTPTTSEDLVLNYNYFDADGDSEIAPIIRWYRNAVHQIALDNLLTVPNTFTIRGDVWYATIQISDGVILNNENTTANITIVNAPAEIRNLMINPFPIYETDNMKVSFQYFDADGDLAKEISIRWYLNNDLQSQYNNQDTILASKLAHKQVWMVIISVNDGSDNIQSRNISNILINKNEKLVLTGPDQKTIKNAKPGENITWTISDQTTRNPTYSVLIDGKSKITNQSWTPGIPINFSIPELNAGKYNVTIIVFDGIDSISQDTVIIQIKNKISPWIIAGIILGVILVISIPLFLVGTNRGWWKKMITDFRTDRDRNKTRVKTDKQDITNTQATHPEVQSNPSEDTESAQTIKISGNLSQSDLSNTAQSTKEVEKTVNTEIIRPMKMGLPASALPITFVNKETKSSGKNAELISPESETVSQIQRRSNVLVEKISPYINNIIDLHQDQIMTASSDDLERTKQKIIEEARDLIIKNVPLNPKTTAALDKLLPKTTEKEIEKFFDSLADDL